MILWQEFKGPVSYLDAMKIMDQNLQEIIEGIQKDTIMLLEHSDVYTAGTSAKAEELLEEGSIPVIYTGRGGKFTYHGLGQRIIYPIIDLRSKERDLKAYIRKLESWIISTLEIFGVKAYTIPERVGIWVQDEGVDAKIGAIGVRVKKWVAYHGIAVNLYPNLEKFNGIIPCGITDAPVTSLQKLGIKVSMEDFDRALKQQSPF